jgi:gliding motility-associated-like protein
MHLHLRKYLLLLSLFGVLLPLAAQTDTLCQADPVGNYHVVGLANSTYFWDTQGDGTITSVQGNDSVQINWANGPGNYQLTVTETSSQGCLGLPITLNIVVINPTISINAPPICSADLQTYSFSVTANAVNLVSSAGTVTNISGNTWLIDGVPSGTDVILNAAVGNCFVNLTVNAPNCNCPPIEPPTATSLAYCFGETVPDLAASVAAGLVIDWYAAPIGGSAVLSGSNTFSPGVAGTWWIESRDPSTGCVSSQRTEVSVIENILPVLTASPGDAICLGESILLTVNGADTYTWSPPVGLSAVSGSSVNANPIATTTYTVIGTDANGCNGSATIALTVNEPYSVATEASICVGESYDFFGQTITTEGNYQATLSSIAGCDSLINLTLIVIPQLETTTSSSICAGSSYLFEGTNYTLAGTYRDTLQSINGCDSILVLNLSVFDEINVSLSASICEGSNYTLPDGSLVNIAGEYPFVLTAANGCDSVVTVTLTVDPAINITLSDDVEICSGSSTILEASGAEFYLWVPALGLSDSTGASVTASPTVTTNYVVYANTGLCSDIDSVSVTVLPVPVLNIEPSAQVICVGDSISLLVSGAESYVWSTNIGGSLSCDTCSLIQSSPQENTIYTVVGTNGNCTSSTSVSIAVVPVVIANITGDTTLCLGETVQISASGGSIYNWSTGDSTAVVNFSVSENTIVTVEVSNGLCSDTTTTELLVYPLPTVDAGLDTTIQFGASAQIEASSSAIGTWYPGIHLSCDDCLDPIADPPSTETYCLTVVNEYGCAASDCITITVDTLCADVFIPNVFAPDAGGHTENNCFKLYGTDCIVSMALTVYNRWGEKVFESSRPGDCWDGNFKGKPLNSGVYVYYLEAELITGESLSKQGNLTLMR